MFETLPESQRARERVAGSTAFSVVAHGGLCAAIVLVTAGAGLHAASPVAVERVHYVNIAASKTTAKPRALTHGRAAHLAYNAVSETVSPDEVPPQLDLANVDVPDVGAATVDDDGVFDTQAEFSHKPRPRALPAPKDAPNVYYNNSVDKPAADVDEQAKPNYPELLHRTGMQGEVLATFVVDTTGEVDIASFKVVRSTHYMFTDAVRAILPQMRFIPAEASGVKVRTLVEYPFQFVIR